MSDSRLEELIEQIRTFVREREWSQFHDPKNLAMSLASEAGELLAELRWVSSDKADAAARDHDRRSRIENEVGDVAISLLLFCDRIGIDVIAAAEQKLRLNAANYPVANSKGKSDRPQSDGASITRTIAVDWSGAISGARDTIWYAEVENGDLVRLENGRSREQVVQLLIGESKRDPRLAVGLDFAFGFPEWFSSSLASSFEEVWRLCGMQGERWLADCATPFWGRPGVSKPQLKAHFRSTEAEIARRFGGQPKSVFQIGGAGAVGTGSIRGMPHLLTLREAGFAVWPFDPPKLPVVVEIYPRLLTGPVVKSDERSRTEYLERVYPDLGQGVRRLAASTEDAFDAAVSAMAMWAQAGELAKLERVEGPAVVEGQIWFPSTLGDRG